MEQESLDRLLKVSKNMFYTDFVVIVFQLIAIFVAIRNFRIEKWKVLFLIYCISGLLLMLSNEAKFFLYPVHQSDLCFSESVNLIFAVIEFNIFYQYFRAILISQFVKNLLLVFNILIILSVLIFFIKFLISTPTDAAVLAMSDIINAEELFFLAIPCLFYYVELFRKKPVINLPRSPSFWIVTGLFFYSIIIIPFFIVVNDEFIKNEEKIFYFLFAIHYILFGFVFLAITKAFLCRRALTT